MILYVLKMASKWTPSYLCQVCLDLEANSRTNQLAHWWIINILAGMIWGFKGISFYFGDFVLVFPKLVMNIFDFLRK